MPQKITCRGCGEIFYEGNDLKAPEEFIQKLKGVCPKCGKDLLFDATTIEINVSEEELMRRR